jgi:cyclopropane fatty-acyl-phospholipid synthase-like methyltransferase
MANYAIAGGLAGKERLDVLQRVHGPFTRALLDSTGIKQGARCLDAGCGGGHVSRDLAARVGKTGSVSGLTSTRWSSNSHAQTSQMPA